MLETLVHFKILRRFTSINSQIDILKCKSGCEIFGNVGFYGGVRVRGHLRTIFWECNSIL